MSPMSLKNVKVSTVKPYTKSKHPAIVEPALFDLTGGLDIYIPIVFFYKPERGQEADASIKLVGQLKESLSKVLVPYFPMAGRWVRTYDARLRELECDDEGVTFIEASIDENLESVVRMDDLEPLDLLAGHHFLGLDPKVLNQDVESPLPSLFIQVTKFKCGSVSLNASFCHMTADGKGMFAFMEAWSETALHGQTSIVPIHDRSLTISLAEFKRSLAGNAGGRDVVEPENVSTEKVDTNTRRVDPGSAYRISSKPTSCKTLHVRRQVIQDMKREAALKNMNVTTMDLISTHFWLSFNRIPESLDGKKSAVLATVVEGRSRYHDPSLPERYSGNVLLTGCTPQVSASALAAEDSPLIAANILHNSIQEINASSWQSFMLKVFGQSKDVANLDYRLFVTSAWLRFPMYDISFGHGFGKPILANQNTNPGFLPYGVAFVHPPPPALADIVIASVQFLITSDDVAKILFSHEKFRSFFLPFEYNSHS